MNSVLVWETGTAKNNKISEPVHYGNRVGRFTMTKMLRRVTVRFICDSSLQNLDELIGKFNGFHEAKAHVDAIAESIKQI